MKSVAIQLRNEKGAVRKAVGVILLLFIIKSLVFIFFFPEFEGPDELFHTRNIVNGDVSSGYYRVMHFLLGTYPFEMDQQLDPSTTQDFKGGSNKLLYDHQSSNQPQFIYLKLFQLAFLLTLIMVLYLTVFSNRKPVSLGFEGPENDLLFFMLFLSWPQVAYGMTILSSDFLTYVYNFAFFVLLFRRRRYFAALIGSVLLIFLIDKNPIVNVVFLVIYFINDIIYVRFFSMKKPVLLASLNVLAVVGFSVVIAKGYISAISPYLKASIDYGNLFSHDPLNRIGVLFLSILYMGGSMSLRAFVFDYACFGILIVYGIQKMLRTLKSDLFSRRLFLYGISFLSAFFVIMAIIPMFAQAKYYYFIVPIILLLIQKSLFGTDGFTPKVAIGWAIILFFFSVSKIFWPVIIA